MISGLSFLMLYYPIPDSVLFFPLKEPLIDKAEVLLLSRLRDHCHGSRINSSCYCIILTENVSLGDLLLGGDLGPNNKSFLKGFVLQVLSKGMGATKEFWHSLTWTFSKFLLHLVWFRWLSGKGLLGSKAFYLVVPPGGLFFTMTWADMLGKHPTLYHPTLKPFNSQPHNSQTTQLSNHPRALSTIESQFLWATEDYLRWAPVMIWYLSSIRKQKGQMVMTHTLKPNILQAVSSRLTVSPRLTWFTNRVPEQSHLLHKKSLSKAKK